MDGWMDRQADRWVGDGSTDEWTDGRTDSQVGRWMDGWTTKQMEGKMDGRVGQTLGWMDEQKDGSKDGWMLFTTVIFFSQLFGSVAFRIRNKQKEKLW